MIYTTFSYKDNKHITKVYEGNVVIKCLVDGVVIFETDNDDDDLDILTKSRYKSKQKVENKIRKKVSFNQDGIASFVIEELLSQCLANLVIAHNKSAIKEHCEITRCILGILSQAQDLELLKPATAKQEKDIGSIIKMIKSQKRTVY